ncbi:hypothetical protein Scep_020778 [Stephania cephalantha]|uniref:Thaumatin-like protein 1 n=1 Tax=Stephania cephalantha TaxID=152367 RepID=A0AAP0NPA7_9MAGN
MESPNSSFIFFLSLLLLLMFRGVPGATFTFINNCDYTVWPGILANAGSPVLETTGFELPKDTSRTLEAPTGWSGRFWARTGCSFNSNEEQPSCRTGDCGSGQPECNGAGAVPPVTLAEFTLGSGSQDFYDVSLVDGYNLAMLVEAKNSGEATCASTGCLTDLNQRCPAELRVEGGEACKSACEQFGKPEYCCSGAYSNPSVCKPTVYSQIFKSACPRSYSYAYDDASSTFTCTAADYTITFCPSSYPNSQKSSRDPTTPVSSSSTTGMGTGTGTSTTMPDGSSSSSSSSSVGEGSSNGGSWSGSGSGFVSEGGYEAESGSETVMLADGSWIAGLATGGTPTTPPLSSLPLQLAAVALVLLSFIFTSPHFHFLH